MRDAAQADEQAREALVQRFRSGRERTRQLFDIPRPESYYDRPIRLRNPIVFYEGHLPAFNINTLIKLGLGQDGIDADYERLFERGIDPEDEGGVKSPADLWPEREDVRAFAAAADRRIEKTLRESDLDNRLDFVETVIEHEFMHHESLLYMFHNMAYEKKNTGQTLPPPRTGRIAGPPVLIPAGIATLGAKGEFGWDNEFPQHQVEVGAFAIDRFNVTNGDYLEFMNATGTPSPHFWLRKGGQWYWRGMFTLIPLPLDWPVYVTHEEAESFARWRGKRLPAEAEYHRAAFGTPSGKERRYPWGDEPPDATRGNFDFQHWDPVPAGSYPAGASAWGVDDLVGNGWEWTSSLFAPFDGFKPMRSYPVYSSDFFDGQHYVLKGASPATSRHLVRGTFRNWFRPNYPYLYATFRCVV